ncbi:hypothetical protein QQ008_14280 [Fulvivirgaceae bacterium BMA10]|uniref:Uncharacterized protein n=1 Tax=Splendidivirga corallicola TaxID=3051826 RepID=A0ABT8KP96_9BACT|nr:hypothetical protein [Fulvivirgaceae bacterium BMA10]
MSKPSNEELIKALNAAGSAHHDYEAKFLKGKRDEFWAGWYASYVLGRLGDFATPSDLTNWLTQAPSSDDWFKSAAQYISERL